MASPSPVRFNPALLARKFERDNGISERLSVAFPLSRCKRLLPLLSSADTGLIEKTPDSSSGAGSAVAGSVEWVAESELGQGQFKAEFELKQSGKHVHAVGEFSVRYPLQCQRCLHNFELDVSETFDFVFVVDQVSAEALPDDLDPVVLEDDGMIHVVDLFEDELIFHVPTVPKHVSVELCTFGTEVELDEGLDGVTAGIVISEDADTQHLGTESSGGRRTENPFAVLKNLHLDK